ncbi:MULTISPECIES: efflux transporter outer membrane subunit [Raoultella]|uniref:efflux transporter outer membrane subunit n=1 Tax=Raoultella TaxID=160674 RepID=UPI002166DEE2|nr:MULTISPECIES: efflux transporter outer membrane subunit [Raoultella]MCS4271823.1 NodT family efflux transporter outer membrane factor (OMF) lipoprotein [Raoultella sp. BIGb0132]MCS4287868.1 NodT family efflux transporter outer membrane factor (OMF) lipoprotein [Raoultella terrigena]
MMRRLSLALALGVALAGCRSADVPPAAPSLQIPAAWRADIGPASALEGWWWRNFHDSQLNQYVEQALRYNSDVLIARERVNEYQARAYAADSSLFPSLDASLTGSRARAQSAATGLPVHSTVYKGGLTASYDVDIWGANRSAADAAEATLEAQKAAAAAADLTVATSVAAGYLTLLSLDEQLRVTRQTLKSREDAYNMAKRQFETGYTSRLELMQADSELRSTRAQIPPLEHQIAQQENALSVLIGSNPQAISRQDFAHLTPLALPSQLPSSLLNRRPDIVQAQRQLLAADATLASSQAQLLPSINLTATGSMQDRTLPDLLDNPLRLWSLGGSILAPLLNRQALNAQVDVSMAQRNQALYGYEKTVRGAFREVNDSLDAITRYGEQLTELQDQEAVAQETLRIAGNRYRNGYSSYLDVLDAQRTLFSTQTSVVQVKNNLLLAQVDLYRALGGGWSVSSGT